MIQKAKAIPALGRSPRSASRGALGPDLCFGADTTHAPSHRRTRVLLALTLATALLALTAAPAFAVTTHIFSSAIGASGSGDGQVSLASNSGVAVNSTSHDLYVADTANARVDQFSSSGTFIRAFGADVGGAGVNTCTTGCVAGTPGSTPGAFTTPTFIAVDNSGGASAGDVYVGDTTNNIVTKFDASGTLITTWGAGGQLDGSAATGGPFTAIAGIATDTSGNLFVYDPNAQNWFEFSQDGSADPTVPFQRGTLNVGIGVDGSGNFYKVVGDANVEKFDSSGNDLGAINPDPPPTPTTGFAVDPTSGDIYVDGGGTSISHYDSTCNPTGGDPTGCAPADTFGGSHLINGGGLAVDTSSHTVFAIDGQHVDAFSGPLQVPDVSTADATNLLPNSATLNGHVDPAGGGDITACHFEYVDDADYQLSRYATATSVACSQATPISSPTDVSADISGLTAGTTYHFLLDAANASGDGRSQDETQTDQTLTTAPAVAGLSTDPATNVGPTTATLNGSLDPAGHDTTYHFQYTTTSDFGANAYANATSVPIPDADAGSAAGEAAVNPVDVSNLSPGTSYTFRIVATNTFGTANGNDQSFSTPPPPSIDAAFASNLTPTDADLNAKINPNGSQLTDCHFEYGTDTSYDTSVDCSPDAASIPADSADHAVSAHLTGLTQNTTYHWRVLATNASGTTTGVDHTFIYDTSGQGLPDNRAYEQVTPTQKNAAVIGETGALADVAPDGSTVIDDSIQCFAGAGSCNSARKSIGSPYAFTRTSGGWVTTPLSPPASQFAMNTPLFPSAATKQVLFTMPTPPDGEDDFYVRRPDGTFVDIGPVTPPSAGAQGSSPIDPSFGGLTADFSHLVYASLAQPPIWPFDLGSGGSLYEYVGVGNSQPLLVGVSGGAGSTDLISACGTLFGGGVEEYGALSSDGRTVVFTAVQCSSGTGANAGNAVPADALYARLDESQSVLISGRSPTDCTGGCQSSPASSAEFESASADGSKLFFTSTQQLTDDASQDNADSARPQNCYLTTAPNGCNLYLYDFQNPLGHELTDVSAGDTSGNGPRVQGVMGSSPDGSHVYFVAKGVLTAAANAQGQSARDGANNLYLFERDASHPDGQLAYIASLSDADVDLWRVAGPSQKVNVTPDGRFLVFASRSVLTPDDSSLTGAAQVFRYDAETAQLIRISIGDNGFNDNGNAGSPALCAGQPAFRCSVDASIVPASLFYQITARPGRTDPTMSDDGSYVFFTSPAGLTPHALDYVRIGTDSVSGEPVYAQNVYEYHDGHVHLISDGKDTSSATANRVQLLATDATGANVFFVSADQLVPQDTDTQLDFYDARIGGGFPFTPPPQPCQGDNCKPPPSGSPPGTTPGSAGFSGPGDPTPSRQPATSQKKCKKHHKHKKCKKSRKGTRAANTTGRTGR